MTKQLFGITLILLVAITFGGGALAQDTGGKIILGFPGGVGPTDVPAILALEALKEKGWKTETIEFDSPDIQTQALLNDDIQIASMGPATVFAAMLAGADLRIISNNNRIDWLVVSSAEIQKCSDLDGKLVAYHSTGSTSTAHLRRFLSDTCPDAKPQFMVLSGSANRAAALLNGQIAGTIVRLEDWLAVTGGKNESVRVLATLSKEQPTLLTQTIVVANSKLNTLRPALEEFLAAQLAEFQKVYADPASYAVRALPYLKGANKESLTSIYTALTDIQLFPTEMGISMTEITDSIAFYEESGNIKPGLLSPDKVADFSFSGK